MEFISCFTFRHSLLSSPRMVRGVGYAVGRGPHLAPGEPAAERDGFGEVVLVGRLREAIRRLNPAIPEGARATVRQYRRVQISTGRETMP